jgi:hypothetical protein
MGLLDRPARRLHLIYLAGKFFMAERIQFREQVF